MGSSVQNYCDNCGDDIGEALISEAIQIVAQGSNGIPSIVHICTKPEWGDEGLAPKITGCARKYLSESMLKRFYQDVREYVGDDKAKPFSL